MEHLCTHTDTFAERSCTDRTDHELLEADGGIGVSAAVDDVHHGNGEHICVAATDVFVEGQVEIIGSSLCNSKRNTEDGVCTEVALGIGTVDFKHLLVDCNLIEGAHTYEGFSDRAVNIGNSLEYTLTHITGLVTVAKLESLVNTGRCTRGNGSTAKCTTFKDYVYFNGGIATRVKNLAADDFFNFHNFVAFKAFMFVITSVFNFRQTASDPQGAYPSIVLSHFDRKVTKFSSNSSF